MVYKCTGCTLRYKSVLLDIVFYEKYLSHINLYVYI